MTNLRLYVSFWLISDLLYKYIFLILKSIFFPIKVINNFKLQLKTEVKPALFDTHTALLKQAICN